MKKLLLPVLFLSCFSVATAQTYSSTGAVAIPDGTGACGAMGAPAVSSISVPLTGTIGTPADVTINVDINHAYIGDLVVTLIAPDATSCILVNHVGATVCDGYSGTLPGGNILSFNSTFTTPIPTTVNPVPGGNYAPTGSVAFPAIGDLSTFLPGKSVNGSWSLNVRDHFGSFTGSIVSWNMVFGATALPLNLLSFSGSKNSNGYNEFEWQTGSEKQTASFELEKSGNGSNYTTVSTVMAIGSGNNTYKQADLTANTGDSYYRLKMIDKDRTFSYSNTIRIVNSDGTEQPVKISPSTSKSSITISTGNSMELFGTEAKIFDAMGRNVASINITSQEQRVDISQFSTGVYLLKLANGTLLKFNKAD